MQEAGVNDGDGPDNNSNIVDGSKARNVVQIGKHYGNNYFYPGAQDGAAEVKEGPSEAEGVEPADRKSKGGIWALLTLVAAVYFLISECGGGQIPDDSRAWPSGVRRESVLNVVRGSLVECSEAVVLDPINCPQRTKNSLSGAENVKWALRGNAIDGARIVFDGDKFYVYGNAVMTVRYSHQMVAPDFESRVVPYLAKVSKDGLDLESIEVLDGSPPEPIVKRDPGFSRAQTAEALRHEFSICAATGRASMEPNCPVSGSGALANDEPAHWAFEGDPTLNTRQSFDSSSGLVEVIGSYAVNVRYEDPLLESASSTKSGAYRALLVDEGGSPRVLQIEDCGVQCGQ